MKIRCPSRWDDRKGTRLSAYFAKRDRYWREIVRRIMEGKA